MHQKYTNSSSQHYKKETNTLSRYIFPHFDQFDHVECLEGEESNKKEREMGYLFEETLSSNPKTPIVVDDDNELGLMAVRLANAAAFPMVLKASLELGVFDTLYAEASRTDSFLSPSEIASKLPTTPRNPGAPVLLDRMLRLLASYSMVKCEKVSVGKEQRVYRAEPICRFFLKNNIQDIGSLASQVIVNFDSVFLNTW